jgi:hypothetical protein
MTSKEKKIKALLQLFSVESRIDELNRSKTYYNTQSVYRNRLTALEEQKEKLEDILEGKDTETKTFKFTVKVPEKEFETDWDEDKVIQYLKREHFERS